MSAVNRDLNISDLLFGVGQTTSQSGADQINIDARGIKVFINVSSAGTGSVTVAIQTKDPASGTYVALLTSAAIVANGMTVLTVYPGLAATANVSANDVLPRQWRISATANNANPVNYTIGACLIV
jgi:hypothetical protein